MTTTISKEEVKVCRKVFADVAAVAVNLGCENMAVAAYDDSRMPSVLVTYDTFPADTSTNQNMKFRRISFEGFEGYRVWSCEIEGEELKACLVR